jgi:hypothetical protein
MEYRQGGRRISVLLLGARASRPPRRATLQPGASPRGYYIARYAAGTRTGSGY